MNRRTVLTGSGAVLSLPFGGCLSAVERSSEEPDDEGETEPESRYPCYDVLELRAIFLENRVDWDDADVAVVPSDDDRIAGAPTLAGLLADAIAREDVFTVEYADDEFDAVEAVVTDADGVSDPVSDLPEESIPGVPPGPYVRHEHRRFAVESDTYRQCDE